MEHFKKIKKIINVDIYYINYKDYTLASPINEDDDFDKTIESSLKENNVKYNKNTKYIKLEVTGSLDDVEINNPTIRYILKGDKMS